MHDYEIRQKQKAEASIKLLDLILEAELLTADVQSYNNFLTGPLLGGKVDNAAANAKLQQGINSALMEMGGIHVLIESPVTQPQHIHLIEWRGRDPDNPKNHNWLSSHPHDTRALGCVSLNPLDLHEDLLKEAHGQL